MCDCFHLAFPNWHAASSGTGGHHSLCSLFPLSLTLSVLFSPEQFTDSAAGFSSAVQWERLRLCLWWRETVSECKAAGADAELCCWPAVSAGCVCRVLGSVWRCHHWGCQAASLFSCFPPAVSLKQWLKGKHTRLQPQFSEEKIVAEDNFLGVKMKKATEIWEQNAFQN